MLPGLRLVLAAITATILLVVLGFVQLVKLHVAQDHSSNFAPVEARFAGLAFAARADWTPVPTFRTRSLESLPPFANFPPARLPLDERILDAEVPAPVMVLAHAKVAAPPQAVERMPKSMVDAAPAIMLDASEPAPLDGAWHTATSGNAPTTIADRSRDGAPEAAEPPMAKVAAAAVAALAAEPSTAEASLALIAAARTPALTVSIFLEATSGGADAAAAADLALPTETTALAAAPVTLMAALTRDVLPLPTPRPAAGEIDAAPSANFVTAALPGGVVPLPMPRPAKAAQPQRRPHAKNAQAPPRKRTAPARPAQPPAPTNPFSALFGG